MTNNASCLICGDTHDISSDARMAAYTAIYRAQVHLGDKLPWREERELFHKTIHEYYFPSRGKIDPGDQNTN
jgi:hypothetical protein